MPHRAERVIAVYPGSFDPVTHGHLDVIRRAAAIFSELIVGVGHNPDKQQLFSPEERLDLLRPHLARLPNARAEAYDGLTFEFVKGCGARVLVRGIRDVADLSDEVQQANMNLLIGGVETVFLLTSDQYVLTSSTYIKQIVEMGGGDRALVERLVPRNVAQALSTRLHVPRRPARRPTKR